MKKLFLLILSFMSLAVFASSTWTETCGGSVDKVGGYYPYAQDYTGWDHQEDCQYSGWYASVRYLERYSANGPHVFLNGSKEGYFTIAGIPGGKNVKLSFDMVAYDSSNSSVSSYDINDLITLLVNDQQVELSATIITSAFSTVEVSVPDAETYSLNFKHAATVKCEVRLDNFIVQVGSKSEQEQTEGCVFEELDGKKTAELLKAVHNMVVDHVVLDYKSVRADKANVDVVNGKVQDMYSSCTFYTSSYCSSGNYDECDCYNREHALPKSFWGSTGSDDQEPMYTDLHHVLPTDFVANSTRSAWPYGEVKTVEWSNSLGTKKGKNSSNKDVFEPVDQYKGDIARIYFYMLACYLDKNFTQGGKGYECFTYKNQTAGFQSAFQSMLLRWHRLDPVSESEIRRNNAVEKKQGNRNPFVDDPSLAEYIWGNKYGQAYTCHLSPSALNMLSYDDIDVKTDGNLVTVSLSRKSQIAVYDITGRIIYFNPQTDSAQLSLGSGLYIITTSGASRKVLVN